MLADLGLSEVRTSTPWTDGVQVFEGVLARTVVERIQAKGELVKAAALNDYTVELPLADFLDNDVLLAMTISNVPWYCRIIRSSVLGVTGQTYIEAARSCGTSDFQIIMTHVLPNAMGPIIVQATMGIGGAIISAAGISFVGMGIQPPAPEWGAMLNEAKTFMTMYPYMVVFPGLAIGLTALSMNLMGDGLRDALDPKLKD